MDEVSPAAKRLLAKSANELGLRPGEILDRVLNVYPLSQDPRFERALTGLPKPIIELLEEIDEDVRALNPGVQYVVRSEFFGYRRSEVVLSGRAAERSQIFLSVVPGIRRIRLVLPLNPADLSGHVNVRDLSGKGHHGVGDVCVDVRDSADVQRFLSDFSDWLGPWRTQRSSSRTPRTARSAARRRQAGEAGP